MRYTGGLSRDSLPCCVDTPPGGESSNREHKQHYDSDILGFWRCQHPLVSVSERGEGYVEISASDTGECQGRVGVPIIAVR